MTPDTDDPRDDWLTVDEKLSVHADTPTTLEAAKAAALAALTEGRGYIDIREYRDDPEFPGEDNAVWEELAEIAAKAVLDQAETELAAVRAIVDSAVTSCQLGAEIAAHFGRPLPDWNTD